jgi:hypothetical protein
VLERVGELADAGNGTLLVLAARGHAASDADRLERLYAETREQEWIEFRADAAPRDVSARPKPAVDH